MLGSQNLPSIIYPGANLSLRFLEFVSNIRDCLQQDVFIEGVSEKLNKDDKTIDFVRV